MIGQKNLVGSISATKFRIAFQAPSLSTNKQQIVIPYYGIADPALTASLTDYSYSMDNGSTWSTMTKSSGTIISGLSFTAAGNSLSFTWEANTDIGSNRYNKQILLRLQATSGTLVTDQAVYTLFIERIVTNASTQQTSIPFPDDYRGIPASILLEKAPKS